jgi:hypothetical protein
MGMAWTENGEVLGSGASCCCCCHCSGKVETLEDRRLAQDVKPGMGEDMVTGDRSYVKPSMPLNKLAS